MPAVLCWWAIEIKNKIIMIIIIIIIDD